MMTTARALTAAAISTVLLAGCATASGAAPTTIKGGYRLYAVDTQVGNAPISVIDAATGHLERTLPVGTPSPDWSRLYVVSSVGSRTTLRAIDTHSANTLAQISFDGSFALPFGGASGETGGLSPNGQWLVAQSVGLRNETAFMLVPTAFTQRPRRISLSGDFSFDAVSNDGSRLYLIESLAASQAGHYRVRQYDVAAGALNPQVVVDKREIASASMTGTRISGVFSPDGRWQYSLYINQDKGPFIHALNLESPFAWCIDLPTGGGTYQQMMWSLAINPNGSALFAVNPTLGKIARVDISPDGPSSDVSQVSSFAPGQTSLGSGFFSEAVAKGMQLGSSVLSRDGQTLIATSDLGTVAIEVAGLKLKHQLLADPAIESVVMSDDGTALFASSWSGPALLQVNPTTGTRVKVLQTDSAWLLYRAEHR
jgi:outer membrane lipoprotein SlyB